MLVKGILSTFAALSRLASPKPQAEAAAEKTQAAPASQATATTGVSDSMRRVLAEYDVTRISPRAFSEMLQKLHQAGAVTEKDFQELSVIRLELERDGVAAEEQVNLVEVFGKKLGSLPKAPQNSANTANAPAAKETGEAALRRRIEWLEKFARVHASGGLSSFDTLA